MVEKLTDDQLAELSALCASLPAVEWGATAERTDEGHAVGFATSLAKTRDHFKMDGDTALHGLYVKGTDIVFCHTGNSPNSQKSARALEIFCGVMPMLLSEVMSARSKDSPQ